MPKSVLIVGGGIAGLSAGCYLQMNGFKTTILEKYSLPGGCCTSWKRKKYTVNGCIHWLVGTQGKSSLNRIWRELGALENRQILYHRDFVRFEQPGRESLLISTNLDQMEKALIEAAPEDRRRIASFVSASRRLRDFRLPTESPPELWGARNRVEFAARVLPHARDLARWKRISIQDFSKGFKNPLLRRIFPLLYDFDDFSMLAVALNHAWLDRKLAGYPIGGSLEFAKAIEKRYRALGGEIRYQSQVDKITVRNHRASGVVLRDGTALDSDFVVSACDGYTTLYRMLDGQYVSDELHDYYRRFKIFQPLMLFSFGVKRPLKEHEPSVLGINFPLKKPIELTGLRHERVTAQIYNFDPTLVPENGSIVKLSLKSDYRYWSNLRQNRRTYRDEKNKLCDLIVENLDERFSGISDDIEIRDVASPATFERYTGNWQGTYEGWIPTTENMGKQLKKSLPGLGHFYMAGHWTVPGGGVPTAAITGLHVARLICAHEKKPFERVGS